MGLSEARAEGSREQAQLPPPHRCSLLLWDPASLDSSWLPSTVLRQASACHPSSCLSAHLACWMLAL